MDNCWRLIAAVGAAFMATGWLDVGLFWFPLGVGDAGWEFGVISASLNGLPVPVMGTALLLTGAVGAGHRRLARFAQVAAVGAVVVVGLMAVLYGLSVVVVIGMTSDPTGMSSITKTIVRSIFQIAVYPMVLGVLVFRANQFIKRGDVT